MNHSAPTMMDYRRFSKPDISGTLGAMLQIHPNAKQVLVVMDSTVSGNVFKQELNQQIQPFKDRLSFRVLAGRQYDLNASDSVGT